MWPALPPSANTWRYHGQLRRIEANLSRTENDDRRPGSGKTAPTGCRRAGQGRRPTKSPSRETAGSVRSKVGQAASGSCGPSHRCRLALRQDFQTSARSGAQRARCTASSLQPLDPSFSVRGSSVTQCPGFTDHLGSAPSTSRYARSSMSSLAMFVLQCGRSGFPGEHEACLPTLILLGSMSASTPSRNFSSINQSFSMVCGGGGGPERQPSPIASY